MIVNPSRLECVQVYPDRGLMTNDRFDYDSTEEMTCGYCGDECAFDESGCCAKCLKELKELEV